MPLTEIMTSIKTFIKVRMKYSEINININSKLSIQNYQFKNDLFKNYISTITIQKVSKIIADHVQIDDGDTSRIIHAHHTKYLLYDLF